MGRLLLFPALSLVGLGIVLQGCYFAYHDSPNLGVPMLIFGGQLAGFTVGCTVSRWRQWHF